MTTALLAPSANPKGTSVGSLGSGTDMIVLGVESMLRYCVVPTWAPPGAYWSTLTCSQRR